ncbi:MAG: putative transcriptional regulatory protein [Alphaproteobacteria bacterium ADurb.Bin438]|nr:MAG: putative transcriptional regulatory protein [Alphaproteobacteria bacterium ADurb.Bin438]
MAGHSQFKNIMHRKGAQDRIRAKIFSKLGREITVAVKTGGSDINYNSRLRLAISAAKAQNMPKDNIERAIKKGSPGEDSSIYEEIRYEGMGPHGVAFIVEALTDNRARTAPNVRSIFSKKGGNLGETNSVAFNFERIGYIEFPLKVATQDAMFEAGLEAGADDVVTDEECHQIITKPTDLGAVREILEKTFGTPDAARLDFRALNTVTLNQEQAEAVLALEEALNEDDDVQRVYANYDISDEIMEKIG